MPSVVPVSQLRGSRLPEQGRIRTGVKTAKAMKAINTFRFTSPDEKAINQIAELYGGEPKPWSDTRAGIKNQFEVITTSRELRVVLPSESVEIGYELWGGKGRDRMCDGEQCIVPHQEEPVPCMCAAKGVLTCDFKTRIRVILPDVPFGGVWRWESKSEQVFKELTTMADFIEMLNSNLGQPIEATMRLEERTSKGGGQTKHYNIVTLSIDHSTDALLTGEASYVGPPSISAPAQTAIEAPLADAQDEDAQEVIYDAEVLEEPVSGQWVSRDEIPPNTPVKYDRANKVWVAQ